MSEIINDEITKKENPLGYKPLGSLLKSIAIPAIIANVVNALYNIVDQIFIGQGVGYLGNAATNIAFPIVTICLAIGLMIGIGAASSFNLELGRKNYKKAKQVVGTAGGTLLIIGILLCIVIRMFLESLMISFGATEQILKYAMEYTAITSYGIPFLLFSIGTNALVRADGSPKYSMVAIIVGAILNTILDPVLMFVFNMGISGAAWATTISQAISALILILYFTRFKSVKLELKDFIPNFKAIFDIMSLGFASFVFQISNVIVQIAINNQLKKYGATSVYGSDIPIAVAGVVSKINVLFYAVVLGLGQGSQPILGFNYGAKKYKRVRDLTRILYKWALIIATIIFVLFQLFPAQIVSIFGSGNELYHEFSVKYMRIFMMFMFLNGVVTITMLFFPALGKAKKGAILSVSKQIIILLPLLLILPIFVGVYGIVWAYPITDFLTFGIAVYLVKNEFKKMPKENEEF